MIDPYKNKRSVMGLDHYPPIWTRENEVKAVEELEVKRNLLKNLEITQNPYIYTLGEMKRYEQFKEYKQNENSPRFDRNRALRTDDIEGASVNRWWLKRNTGKRT